MFEECTSNSFLRFRGLDGSVLFKKLTETSLKKSTLFLSQKTFKQMFLHARFSIPIFTAICFLIFPTRKEIVHCLTHVLLVKVSVPLTFVQI